jgi:hypothetical protein
VKNCLLIIFLISGLFSLFAQTQGASIKEMTGTVELKLPGTAEWAPAKVGDTVSTQTLISTGFKSIAVLAIGESVITVRPLTRLSLEELTALNTVEQVSLNLRAGRIRAEVTPPAGTKTDFTVRGPTVTASVRGTAFDFDTVNLRVSEGTVMLVPAVRGVPARPIPVSAGQSSYVDAASGKAMNPGTISETARQAPANSLPRNSGSPRVSAYPDAVPQGAVSVDVVLSD